MLYKSNLLAQASGSLDGTVFSHNRFGRYTRNGSRPVNPLSERQALIRAQFTAVASRWESTLTQAQRDAWDVYAANIPTTNKLGDEIFLTGFNHYIRSNTAIQQASGTIVDDGPTDLTLPAQDGTVVVTASEATQLLSVAFDDTLDWLDESGGFMTVFMGLPAPASHQFFGGPYRFAASIAGDDTVPPTTPETMAAPFVFAAGQKLWIRTRILRVDGRISSQSTFQTVAVA